MRRSFTWIACALAACAGEATPPADDGASAARERRTLEIRLHDGPTDEVDEVWLSIASVEVEVVDGWRVVGGAVELELLSLTDGLYETIGLADLEPGEYGQVRMHLADAWVVMEGERRALTIPSVDRTGVKIVSGFTVPECGSVVLDADWDAAAHLNLLPSGEVKLRPTLHVTSETIEAACLIDADASGYTAWTSRGGLHATMWSDGTLWATSGGAGYRVSPDGTNAPYVVTGGSITPEGSIWAEGGVLVAGNVDHHVFEQDGTWLWALGSHGCCSSFPPSLSPLDDTALITADGWLRKHTLSAYSPRTQVSLGGSPGGVGAVDGDAYWFAGTDGRVARYTVHPTLARQWDAMVWSGRQPSRPAVGEDGAARIADAGDWRFGHAHTGDLAAFEPSGAVRWRLAIQAASMPILGADDVVFVGRSPSGARAQVPGTASAVDASGNLLWTQPVDGRVRDAFAGDDGRFYALAGAAGAATLYAWDQRTGELGLVLRNVAENGRLLLDHGVLYVTGTSTVRALDLPVGYAVDYDPSSAWPVVGHDNQRTAAR